MTTPTIVRVRPQVPPKGTRTYSTTARPIPAEAQRVVEQVRQFHLRQGRDQIFVRDASAATFSDVMVEDLTEQISLMIEGYREMATFDLELAERDLPATREALPPD